MDTNTALLERCTEEWKALLKELKATVETEEKEYFWAVEGDDEFDEFVELLLNSREMSAHLQAHLTKVLRLQERAER